ncbi:AAA family ATPase [Micromonospora sp. NPDC049559]|uniref:ATP-binding protein n=1 Tax=Micromonospora sp. NPDC049559 TaxID=3155923 RepID=UPI0034145A80
MAPGERLCRLAEAARRGDLADRWRADLPDRWLARPADRRPRPLAAPGVPAPATPRDPLAAAGNPLGAGVPGAPVGPVTRPPVPLTPLLGRDELLADVRRRLATDRLVTLTGPGGAGKTRLALALAHGYATGPGRPAPVAGDVREVWFVDLSAVESPVRVPEALAAPLGVRPEPGGDLVEALTGAIGAARVLLVLDNCEHVLTGCAELAGRLLAACPGLRVLATSRSALRLPGETVVAVPTLGTPAPGARHTIAELTAHPATRLFLDRARARSGRPLAEGEAGAVARICAELDGLPLAIELAAARVPLLGPGEILDRLRADPRLLRSPDPTVPSRHRTLAAAVESSVEQLGPHARTLFERLGAVAAGFDADAARALVGPAGPDALAELLAASLVEVDPGPVVPGTEPAPARYRMLMPIRRHALARLAEGGGEVVARQAHAWYCLALAERADPWLRGAGREHWLHRLRVEAANLRAAMRWLAEAGAGGSCHGDLRLAAALTTYCRLEGNYRQGYAWLAEALARHPGAPAALRARAGTGAALLAMLLCDYPAAADHARAARAACREAGDRRGEARLELVLGSVARERARYAESAAHLAIAAALFAECGDEWDELQVLLMRGFTAWLAGDLDRAESRLRSGLRRCVRLADGEAEATALMHLGAVALYRGDADGATSLLDVALQRYAALGFPEGVGWAHNLRGLLELRARRPDRAAAHLSVSLATHREVGDRWRTASVLEAMAELARLERRPVRAARLLGAAARIRDEIGAPVPDCERPETGATGQALRSELGADAFEAAHRYGREATLDALLAEAFPADPYPDGAPGPAPALPLGR